MGRWRSSLIIFYSGQKGSTGITQDTARGIADARSGLLPEAAPVPPRPDIDAAWLEDTAEHTRQHMHLEASIRASHNAHVPYATNIGSGVVHKIGNPHHTLCGRWKTGVSHAHPVNVAHPFYCSRCCRYERKDSRLNEASSSESDCG